MASPRTALSVCLIARNEADNLPRALQSVKSIADELIVVDTGSTDATVEVAEQFGARVGHFVWCDDFAAARNAALELAKGDWILLLDADEELLGESVPELRRCIARSKALAYLVLRRDLVKAEEPEIFTQMWQLRLFRRRSDLRFRGRCHPDFHPSLPEIAAREGRSVRRSAVVLRHYGYVAELREGKLQRAVRLLDLELQDRPGQLYYLIEYFRTLHQLGDSRASAVLAEAVAHVIPHEDEDRPPSPMVALLLETLLQMPAEALPGDLTARRVQRMAERWFPNAAPLLWLRAERAFAEGRFEGAERLLRKLLALGRDHGYDATVSFDPRIVGDDAAVNLGVCLVRQGKLAEAERIYRGLLASPIRGRDAEANLAVVVGLRREAGVPDAIGNSTSKPRRPPAR